ncbi:hypothetical protein BH11ARM1_BH11ARM1_08650 [soil metagenome]
MRLLLLLGSALLAGSAAAETIQYRVTSTPDMAAIKIDIKVDCAGQTLDLVMPNWTPGYYVQQNNGESLKEVTAVGADGKPRAVSHPRPDTWHVDTLGSPSVTVSYSREIGHTGGAIGIFSSDADTIHYGGPSIYLYVAGKKEEACELEFQIPKDAGLAVSLDPLGGNRFSAKNYDMLADSPVTIGKFKTVSYESRGKPHLVVLRGQARDTVSTSGVLKLTKFITESETDFFGQSAPYSRYVWHIWTSKVPDGGGGLEHASSSQDFMAESMGPGAVRGLSHEFFHLWNVKRIRSDVLGPFDYRDVPRTGAFWWLEGVTDYYASLIPHRYGWYGDAEYLRDVSSQIRTVRGNPKRLEVSPYEGSFRVGEANGGKGNSDGFGISYYPTGWLLGMLFDVEIRSRSGGNTRLMTLS